MAEFGDIDLDVLRGWREEIDPALQAEHALPPLARLVALDAEQVETIHGPDVLVGRYNPQYGPVDVILGGLEDHQNYRLGAPHLHLTLGDGQWGVRSVTPGSLTLIDGEELAHGDQRRLLESGSVITMGHVRYRLERSGLSLDEWEDARARLLNDPEQINDPDLNAGDRPALFLCRRGGPCGPRIYLDEASQLVVGRSFPDRATLAGEHSWDGRTPPDWDLAGLYEAERKFIAFEHAHLDTLDSLDTAGRRVELTPVASRRKTFVNRLEIIDTTPLSSGDEIALGSVIFYLHEPSDDAMPERKAIEPPAVIDWQEGSTPILDESGVDQAGADETGADETGAKKTSEEGR
jgi:hypothetical protein